MKDKRFLRGVAEIVGQSAHSELMRGTIAQNDKYVEKEGDCHQFRDEGINTNSARYFGLHFQEIEETKLAWQEDSDDAFDQYLPTFVKYLNLIKVKDKKRINRLNEGKTN